jgi:predicted Zn-dependent protease with MMP-like domain
MNLERFERRAREVFDAIPPEFRGGVEYVVVHPDALPHPDLPEVYTLGECSTGELDLGMDLPNALRSGIHLYHGSFRRVAALDPDFDWEAELEETVVHEIRHHRESAAGEDALEEFDYAADENFKRREGLPFDPLFYRAGEPAGQATWEVDGDLFMEIVLARGGPRPEEIEVEVSGRRVSVPVPDEVGDVAFLYLEGFDRRGETAVVLVRRRGALEGLLSLLGRGVPRVLEWTVEPADWRADPGEGDVRGVPLA